MSHELIAITMFAAMMAMLLSGQRVFGAIGFVAAAIMIFGGLKFAARAAYRQDKTTP